MGPSVYPFLSSAEDLLKCLGESLIEKLAIISSYRKGKPSGSVAMKREKYEKSWGKFSQCELELTEVTKVNDNFSPQR